jgi:gliding motility-associated lipoprotein GldH
MNKFSFIAAAGFLSAIILISCSGKSVYNSSVDIPNEKWNIDSLATFSVDIADTSSVHNIFVTLRNTTEYPNSNLYLFIQTTSPTGAMLRDTLECILADTRGNWLGKGFGALRDNQIPYKQFIRFPETGSYKFSIQHGMRTTQLKGVASVGIRVEKAKM